MLLTGTPMANSSAGDLFTLLSAVGGADCPMPRFLQWCEHFCAENRPVWTRIRSIPNWRGVNSEQEQDLRQLLCKVMVRKTKADVLSELPRKRRSKVRLELTPLEMKKVNALKQRVEEFEGKAHVEDENDDDAGPKIPTHEVMQVFKVLAEAKQDAVCEWLETTYFDGHDETGGKILIFAHHKSVHEKLAAFLEKQLGSKGDKWIQITGETTPYERSRQLERFKADFPCRFALLALQACGAGLNLNMADTCIFAELCWTPSTLEQAEARIHRMGQQSACVLIYYLVAGGKDSPDTIMLNAVCKKADTSARIIDGSAVNSSLRDAILFTPKRRSRTVQHHRDADMQTPPKRFKTTMKSILASDKRT
jgi:SNF2 family DNA or RNA helicase